MLIINHITDEIVIFCRNGININNSCMVRYLFYADEHIVRLIATMRIPFLYHVPAVPQHHTSKYNTPPHSVLPTESSQIHPTPSYPPNPHNSTQSHPVNLQQSTPLRLTHSIVSNQPHSALPTQSSATHPTPPYPLRLTFS